MQALIKTLPALIAESDTFEMRRAIVFAMWPSVVGNQLKERSIPIDLTDDILGIAVCDANWKREFEHHAASIVFKLNKAVGKQVVKRIACAADPDRFGDLDPARADGPNDLPSLVDPNIVAAAARIADADLRKNFLSAASICSERVRK